MYTVYFFTYLLCSLLVLSVFEARAQTAQELRLVRSEYYAFTLHEGGEYHEGAEDLSGELTLYSTGESLIAEMHVTDDQLLDEDYVTLWFNLISENTSRSYRYPHVFAQVDSTLFCLSEHHSRRSRESTLQFLTDEIRDPLVVCSNPGREYRRSNLDSFNYGLVTRSVDEYLPTPVSIESTSIFYGLTGFRIDVKSGSVSIIRPEAYDFIEGAAGSSRADWLSFASLEREVVDQGVTMSLTLPPEALGFMRHDGYWRMRVLMEVFDVDAEGVSRFSTSPDSSTADSQSFPLYTVTPRLTADLHPVVHSYGSPITNDVARDLASIVPLLFFYSEVGWVPVSFDMDYLDIYDQPMWCGFEHITKCSLRRELIDYQEAQLGRHRIENISTSQGTVQIVNDTTSQKDLTVLETFLFPDGSFGQVSVEKETGGGFYRWDLNDQTLVLNRNGERLLELAKYHNTLSDTDLRITLADSMHFNPRSGEFQNWEKVTTMDEDGTGLVVDLGERGRYRISWGEAGDGIRVEALDD